MTHKRQTRPTLRHLSPTATPLSQPALYAGLRTLATADSLSHTHDAFRNALRTYLGVDYAFCASSGRTALYLLLTSLQEDTSDSSKRNEVILPAYTCPSLVKVIIEAGLQPRLVDIVSQTLAYDRDALRGIVSEETLAVLVVHPFGIPQEISEIQAWADQVGAVVIEDAAQSMGASIDGQLVGTRGDYGLFSLGPGKPLSTGGGGIVCTSDPFRAEKLAKRWDQLPVPTRAANMLALTRLLAFTAAFHPTGWWLATRAGAQRVGENEKAWGFSLRGLTSVQAAVAAALLPQLAHINAQRRTNALRLLTEIEEHEWVQVYSSRKVASYEFAGAAHHAAYIDTTPIYLRLPILVADGTRREALFQQLRAFGIGVGKMYDRTLAEYFPQLFPSGSSQRLSPCAEQAYPGAVQVARGLLTLPTHHYLTEANIQLIGDLFRQQSALI